MTKIGAEFTVLDIYDSVSNLEVYFASKGEEKNIYMIILSANFLNKDR